MYVSMNIFIFICQNVCAYCIKIWTFGVYIYIYLYLYIILYTCHSMHLLSIKHLSAVHVSAPFGRPYPSTKWTLKCWRKRRRSEFHDISGGCLEFIPPTLQPPFWIHRICIQLAAFFFARFFCSKGFRAFDCGISESSMNIYIYMYIFTYI